MLDRWSSAGNDVPRQIHDTCDVPLPMDEVEFVFLTPETAPPSPTRPGLYGRMVQLADVFCQVQDLHRQHVDHNISNLEAEERTYHLASALDQFANTLPPDLQMSETNLHSNAERGLGSAFVALHLGYHHYSTLLYFQYLDLQLDQNATVVDFAAKCRHHAAAFSDLLGLSMKAPGCGVVYLIVAHMTAVSSATLLHTLFFGRQEELDETRERLKANFETLVRLKRFWPAVAHMVSLNAFNQPIRLTASRRKGSSSSRMHACGVLTPTRIKLIGGWSGFYSNMRYLFPKRSDPESAGRPFETSMPMMRWQYYEKPLDVGEKHEHKNI